MRILKTAIIVLITLPYLAIAQNSTYPSVVTLEASAPTITRQDGANCFAYASTYVALSTQIAYASGTKADSTHSFSFGYVDGLIEYIGRDSVRRATWHGSGGNINDYGNLDDALYVLKNYGAYHFNRFPYTLEKEINKHFDKKLMNTEPDQRISRFREIITPQLYLQFDSLFDIVEKEVSSGHPIVCAIVEDETYCDSLFINPKMKWKSPPSANHIVTILGYNRDKNTLRVKNNFSEDCVFTVDFQKFCRVMSWAYVFDLNQ